MSSFILQNNVHRHLQILCLWKKLPYSSIIHDALLYDAPVLTEDYTATIPINLPKETRVLLKTLGLQLDLTMSKIINLYVEGYYQEHEQDILKTYGNLLDELSDINKSLEFNIIQTLPMTMQELEDKKTEILKEVKKYNTLGVLYV